MPYAIEAGVLKVALADPADRRTIESARSGPTEFVVASRAAVTNVLGSVAQVRRRTGSLLPVEVHSDESGRPADAETSLVCRAAEAGTTDLHYVPCEDGLSIRARIDGVLREIGQVSSDDAQASISRLKVRAKLDISEQRRSQEGRLTLGSSGRLFDVRITTLPTVAGEGATIRILERNPRPPTLTDIGLSDDLSSHSSVFRTHAEVRCSSPVRRAPASRRRSMRRSATSPGRSSTWWRSRTRSSIGLTGSTKSR